MLFGEVVFGGQAGWVKSNFPVDPDQALTLDTIQALVELNTGHTDQFYDWLEENELVGGRPTPNGWVAVDARMFNTTLTISRPGAQFTDDQY